MGQASGGPGGDPGGDPDAKAGEVEAGAGRMRKRSGEEEEGREES